MDIKLKETTYHIFNKHYQFCTGSGHAPLALRKDYFDQLKMVHDELGIKRVRFHGIFSDEMELFRSFDKVLPIPGGDRFKEINFEKIFDVYDNVLLTGMKPLIELSYMPRELAKNPNAKILLAESGWNGMPKDDEKWQNFIRLFINALLDRYSKKEVESWYFEVWNEPDLIVFFNGSQEDYFHLYAITVSAIKEVDPNIKVGGPATSATHWIKDFISFIKSNHLPCDFISTHQYSGDPIAQIDDEKIADEGNPFADPNLFADLSSGTVLDALRHVFVDKSERDDIPNNTFEINAKTAKKECGKLPIFYTEWNENATFSSSTNDTKKVPAYLVKESLKTEADIDGSSVWCFSDIFEEMTMFYEEFHGGFGLLSRHGIKKPAFYGLEFLNEVGPYRYDVEDTYKDITLGYFKDDNDNHYLLLTRQNLKNLPLPASEINIYVKDNNYKNIYLKRIDEEHGNPFKIYQSLHKRFLNLEEIENIKKQSEVKDEIIIPEILNDELKITIHLKVNDVYLIKLIK